MLCPGIRPMQSMSVCTDDNAGIQAVLTEYAGDAKLNYSNTCGFSGWLSSKESTCNAGDTDLISGSGRSTGEGNGNPLQYSCLENRMDRGAWQATVHGVAESDMTEAT